MADFTHLMNLIQGEVIRIKERTPEGQPQLAAYDALSDFLEEQRLAVLEERVALLRLLKKHQSEPEPDMPIG
jgi:hypothetical protein